MDIKAERAYEIDRAQFTGYDTAFIEVGEPPERIVFVTLAFAFPKKEGDKVAAVAFTPEAAWRAFDAGLRDWLKDKPGPILWRRVPTLQQEEEEFLLDPFHVRVLDEATGEFRNGTVAERVRKRTVYYVACRLAISENPLATDSEHLNRWLATA